MGLEPPCKILLIFARILLYLQVRFLHRCSFVCLGVPGTRPGLAAYKTKILLVHQESFSAR